MYKKNAAIITEIEGEKFAIKWQSAPATDTGKAAKYDTAKVREKDIAALPAKNVALDALLSFSDPAAAQNISEAH